MQQELKQDIVFSLSEEKDVLLACPVCCSHPECPYKDCKFNQCHITLDDLGGVRYIDMKCEKYLDI